MNMAFIDKRLNNIAGSTGYAKIWVYTDKNTAGADLDADNYFAGANKYGMAVGDIIFLVGSDSVFFGYVEVITDTTSQITALTDAAH